MSVQLTYTCPKCGAKVPVETEQTSGIVQIICTNPACGCKFAGKVKVNASVNVDPKPADGGATKTDTPNNSTHAPLPAEKKLKAGEDGEVTCPHCGHTNHVDAKDSAGMKIVSCAKCKGPIEVIFVARTFTVDGAFPYRGKIVVQRFLRNKEYPLGVGKNTIGRADKDCPSDIMLSDDTVSRRSAEIEVKIGEMGGFFFHFRVHKATNPVLVNSQRLEPGDEILLNYGDIITMGKTRLRFDKIS